MNNYESVSVFRVYMKFLRRQRRKSTFRRVVNLSTDFLLYPNVFIRFNEKTRSVFFFLIIFHYYNARCVNKRKDYF